MRFGGDWYCNICREFVQSGSVHMCPGHRPEQKEVGDFDEGRRNVKGKRGRLFHAANPLHKEVHP
jgi:hypothetical protein